MRVSKKVASREYLISLQGLVASSSTPQQVFVNAYNSSEPAVQQYRCRTG